MCHGSELQKPSVLAGKACFYPPALPKRIGKAASTGGKASPAAQKCNSWDEINKSQDALDRTILHLMDFNDENGQHDFEYCVNRCAMSMMTAGDDAGAGLMSFTEARDKCIAEDVAAEGDLIAQLKTDNFETVVKAKF